MRHALLALIMFSVVEHNSWNNWDNLPACVGGSDGEGEGGSDGEGELAQEQQCCGPGAFQQLSGMLAPGGSGAALRKVQHHRLCLPETHLPLSNMGL